MNRKIVALVVVIALVAIVANAAISEPPVQSVVNVSVVNTPNVNVKNTPTVNIADGNKVGITGTTDVNITNRPIVDVGLGNVTIVNQDGNPIPVNIIGGTIQQSIPRFYVYSVKYGCDSDRNTSIDVTNPQSVDVVIYRTVNRALPIDSDSGFSTPNTGLTPYIINPNFAIEINCNTMSKGDIPGDTGPATGFMIINTSKPINVVATYTTVNGPTSQVVIIDPIPIY